MQKDKEQLEHLQSKHNSMSKWKVWVSEEKIELPPERWKVFKEFCIRYMDESKDGVNQSSMISILSVLAALVMTITQTTSKHETAKNVDSNWEDVKSDTFSEEVLKLDFLSMGSPSSIPTYYLPPSNRCTTHHFGN